MQKLLALHFYLDVFVVNEQWDVSFGFLQERNLTYASGRTYSIVEFGFNMDRKPAFYAIALMIPLVASSVIEMATFVLEIDDANRLQLSFTCFLSFTFYISMLVEKLPKNSESMPFLLIAVSVTAGSVCTVIVFQALTFHLATSTKGLVVKMSRFQRNRWASIIDYFAISLYLTTVLLAQILIPVYIYSSK